MSNANIGTNNILLDFKKIKMIRIIMFAKKISQNAKPKKAVHTNVEGFTNGQTAHRKKAIKDTMPTIPTNNFPVPCKKVFLLGFSLSFVIIFYFV